MSERSEVVTDTPHRHGSNSNANHEDQNTQDDYKLYLQVDMQDALTVPFQDLLTMAFGPVENAAHLQSMETIANSAQFGVLMKKFLISKVSETARYAPFNELANYILRELGKAGVLSQSDSIVVCRNDPTHMGGSNGEKKPDCVIVNESAINTVPARKTAHEDNVYPPSAVKFYWSELLTFVEFKVSALQGKPAGGRSTSGTPAGSQPPSDSQSAQLKRPKAKSGPPSAIPKSLQPSAVQSPPQTPLVVLPGQLARSQGKQAQGSAGQPPSDPQPSNPLPASALDSIQGNTSALSLPSVPLKPNVFLDSPSVNSIRNSEGTSSLKRSSDIDIAESSSKRSRHELTSPVIQCASYALELMSCSGFRTHAFGILIGGNQLEFLCFDRSRTVISKPIEFERDKQLLVALLYNLAKATSTQLGHVSAIQPGRPILPCKKDLLAGTRITLTNDIVLEVVETIYTQHALVGRGPCVVHAKVVVGNMWQGKKIVVKLSFTPKSRTPEGEILAHIVKTAKSDKNYTWVLDHIPEVLHSEVILPDPNGLHSHLVEHFRAEDKPFEERVLTILVMTEQHPIEELEGPEDLIKAVIHITKCHQWIFEVAEVLHRDVSLNNMMFRRKGDKVYGVPSDYDLALFLKDRGKEHSSQHRTGTLPFMAIDLLEIPPMLHHYRHDLESIFYGFTILVTGKGKSPFKMRWYSARNQLSQLAWKRSFLGAAFRSSSCVGVYRRLSTIQGKLHTMFADAISIQRQAISAHEFALDNGQPFPAAIDDETLGGHINYQKFICILELSF